MVSSALSQVLIGPGSSITVKEGSSIYVGTDLSVSSDENSSGHFCNQNAAGGYTITGNISVERYLTAGGWHNTSAPVSNNMSSVYTGTDLVFYYDETIVMNDWEFGWVFYNGPLSVMRGYDVYLSDSPETVVYTAGAIGNLNDGSYAVAVTRTDVPNGEIESHKGWNLIGNPYPSPLDWLEETGWDKTVINDAKYIWDPVNGIYTIFLGGNNPVGLNGGTQYIPSNQGFWVQAVSDGTVQVHNSARRGIMQNTPNYYKSGKEQYPMILLEVSGNGFSDQTLVRFLDNAGKVFDRNMDACKLDGRRSDVPNLNTVAGGDRMAINSLPGMHDGLSVEMEFSCGTSGYYQLTVLPSTIGEHQVVYLQDKVESRFIKIGEDQVYSFYHDIRNNRSRFALHFNPSDEVINRVEPADAFSIYFANGKLGLLRNTTREMSGELSVFDLFGHCLHTWSFDGAKQHLFDFKGTSGLYLVSVRTGNFGFSQKISYINQ